MLNLPGGVRKYTAFLCRLLFLIICVAIVTPRGAEASKLDFTTIRLGTGQDAVLVIGGIQGDEPGGFSAACLLATRYEIKTGNVWVVPNLNFPSMIKRSRGLHGDMNRKFDYLDDKDPEYATVRRIQDLITHPQVKLVLNLHDGSGYYRPKKESKLKNPNRWGQSIIIDQALAANDIFMGDLQEQADKVARATNGNLIDQEHAIHVRNTNTALGDKEMEKSLSYYALRKGKAAFGLEASKEFPVHWRAFYHLTMIENFLKQAGVEFERDFELTPAGIEEALTQNIGVSFAGNRIFLPLENARPRINFLPLPKGTDDAITSKPIMAVLPCENNNKELCIHYGNRTLTLIKPEWRDLTDEIDTASLIIDGKNTVVPFGRVLEVKREAIIKPIKGFRVNAIGFECGKGDEAGEVLRKDKFEKRFSVDRAGTLFRVEIYKDQSFAGMFLLRFGAQPKKAPPASLPATKGPESALGF